MKPFCECEKVTGVLRDMYATCVQCGGRDAYKKSPERNNKASTMNNLTQEQVSQLNKGRLNNGIAKLLGIYMADNGFGTVRVWVSGVPNSIKGVAKDYCDNWNDLMPLCQKFGVYYLPEENDMFVAFDKLLGKANRVINQSLKRALVECLFLVLQENLSNELPTKS